MDMRPLGRTGLKVSSLSLGTMTFGEQNTEAEGHAQLDYALSRGINLVDTAEMYAVPPRPETQGKTEEIIGSWFAARGNRDKVILATKVNGRSVNTWLRDGGKPTELTKPQIEEAVTKSLKRLKTDYIDLYQVHWPDRQVSAFGSNNTVFKPAPANAPENPIEETLDALDGLVKAGKVRFIGLSNESAWGVSRYLRHADVAGRARVQSIQNAYSLVNRTFELALAEFALRENVGLLAYSSLAQGYLTGKYRGGALPAGARKTMFNRLQRYEKPGASEAVEAYWALAAELGVSLPQMALKFAETRSFTTSVILGATSVEQLRHDIDAADLAWSAEIEARIDAIHQLHSNPCP